jgi:hypothetical protein
VKKFKIIVLGVFACFNYLIIVQNLLTSTYSYIKEIIFYALNYTYTYLVSDTFKIFFKLCTVPSNKFGIRVGSDFIMKLVTWNF